MDKLNLTLSEAGSLLLGAGLLRMTDELTNGLIIVGIGVVIKVGVALLKKKGIVVGVRNQ
jgi:hypothetical protein